jgi:N-acylneuraminate cytidylyltransferase
MRDGMGLEILRQHQVEVIVMTSENSDLVAARMKKITNRTLLLGVKDKFAFLTHFLQGEKLALRK